MQEYETDQEYWISANGADNPETAGLIQVALLATGSYGAISVRNEGNGKVVQGPASSLFLPDVGAEHELMMCSSQDLI